MSESKQMILDQRHRSAKRETGVPAKRKGRLTAAPISDFKSLVVLVAGALPGDQLADGRTGARDRLLVSFDLGSRSLFADGADAEADLLLFRAHLDDFEVVLNAGFKMQRLTVAIDCFRLVAQTFHAFGDLDKSSKGGHAQHFAVNYVADVMRCEESFPDIGLKLLHPQRQAALVRLNGQHDGLDAITLLQYFRRMFHALRPA